MIISWLKVIALGLTKPPMKLLALFVVPFLNDHDRKHHRIWGASDATDLSWKNIAWKNGVHNMTNRKGVDYTTTGDYLGDETLEKVDGFQWRYRESWSGDYVSFRMTWGEPRDKGKREFYVGWTMNETQYMRLTFFQLRLL